MMKVNLVVLVLCLAAFAPAQTTHHKAGAAKPAAVREECVSAVPLCISVPVAWQRLGDVFDGRGFVVAEPHAEADQAQWPQINVAVLDNAPAKVGEARRTLDALVDKMIAPSEGVTSETQQRSKLLLNGAPAQMVRVRLRDKAANTDIVETAVLIEGENQLVYSIVLRCAPQDYARLEPMFMKTVQNWQLKPTESQPETESK